MKSELMDLSKFDGMVELDELQQEEVDGGVIYLYWAAVGGRVLIQAAKNPTLRKQAVSIGTKGYRLFAGGYTAGAIAGGFSK